jgi:hypothetical protein
MLVDAITDGSSVDDDRDGGGEEEDDDDDPVHAASHSSRPHHVSEVEINTESAVNHSALHNGDASPGTTSAMLATAVNKRKLSSSYWRTNGRKSAAEANSNSTPDTPASQEDSLLRPLLAAGEATTVSLETAQLSSTVVAGKRSRRDTGSSVQSDRSDQSGPTASDQQLSAVVKRSRLEENHVAGAKMPDNG